MEKHLDMVEIDITYNILKNKKIQSVLDIGCGVGRQIIYFAKEFSNVCFWGVDISDYSDYFFIINPSFHCFICYK